MAKNVKITSKTKGKRKYVSVDKHLVRIKEKGDIKFQNKLDNSASAKLEFFDVDDKGGTPISEFCEGSAGSSVSIGNGKIFKCTMTQKIDDYAYTITATGQEELDPIIIIEPQ